LLRGLRKNSFFELFSGGFTLLLLGALAQVLDGLRLALPKWMLFDFHSQLI
jgi:hypothetical protein